MGFTSGRLVNSAVSDGNEGIGLSKSDLRVYNRGICTAAYGVAATVNLIKYKQMKFTKGLDVDSNSFNHTVG